jgi:hypothetical protein
MPPPQELTVGRPSLPPLSIPRVPVRARVALAVCALAALSFFFPSAPTYDPWAWIIWGREVLHLDLNTVDGPSWKPLPVLVTTPFALFGSLAPDLWLFVARAAAIGSVVAVFGLARRLGGLPAGALAAVAYAVTPWTLRNAAMGNSEGLLVLLAVAAIDRHLAGRLRAAFLCALGAALLRPEVWPFVGLYGLWLLVRRPRERVIVGAGLALLPVLWLLPELWGSGDVLRAMHRAKIPNADSAAFAANPAHAVLDQFTSMMLKPAWVGVGALALALVLRRAPSRRDRDAVLVLAGAIVVLVAEVAYMTSDGFSGNTRYLILPAALSCVLAGVGVGWLVRGLPVRVTAAVAVVAAVACAVAGAARLGPTLDAVDFQANLADAAGDVVRAAGGRHALLHCGDPYAGDFQVPVVAWQLHVHQTQVGIAPRAPAVVFRTRNAIGGRPGPSLAAVGGEAGVRTLAAGSGWRIVGTCR